MKRACRLPVGDEQLPPVLEDIATTLNDIKDQLMAIIRRQDRELLMRQRQERRMEILAGCAGEMISGSYDLRGEMYGLGTWLSQRLGPPGLPGVEEREAQWKGVESPPQKVVDSEAWKSAEEMEIVEELEEGEGKGKGKAKEVEDADAEEGGGEGSGSKDKGKGKEKEE